MSRVANSLDNRPIEYWFSILKEEFLIRIDYEKFSIQKLDREIKNFIDYYNSNRLQSNLNYLSPNQFVKLSTIRC